MSVAPEPIREKKLPVSTDDSHKLSESRCVLCGDAADHICLSCGKRVCMKCWNKKQIGYIECFPYFTSEAYAPLQSHPFN